MTITEKICYLKGLMDGLDYDSSSKEGKLFKGILESLEDMALAIEVLEDDTDTLGEVLEELFEDELEDFQEDEECGCGHHHHHHNHDEEYDEDDDFDFDEDGQYYEVVCPTCGEEIFLDEAMFEEGAMECPACGEELEFDLTELDDTEEE